jgi:hypothetical protein
MAALRYHDPEIPDTVFPENMYSKKCSQGDDGHGIVLARYPKLCHERDREQMACDNLNDCIRLLRSFDEKKYPTTDEPEHSDNFTVRDGPLVRPLAVEPTGASQRDAHFLRKGPSRKNKKQAKKLSLTAGPGTLTTSIH